MIRLTIHTEWTAAGTVPPGARWPKVVVDHPGGRCEDVTGQAAAQLLPEPNSVVVEYTVSPELAAQIEAAPAYAGAILESVDA